MIYFTFKVRILDESQFLFGLTCTKAGEVPLQGTCGEFDSLWVHKLSEVQEGF